MRLFLALAVPPNIIANAAEWRARFSDLPVRWLPDQHLHITIVPPWDDVDELPITEALREAEGKIGPISLRFDRVRLAPNPRDPRLIWADGQSTSQLLQLKRHLENTLDIEPDRRPFRLHLMLARFSPEQLSQFRDQHLSEDVAWSGIFSEFILMRSDLFPAGVEYATISTHHC